VIAYFFALVIACIVVANPASAQRRLDGTYVCRAASVDGKTATCSSPPLVFNTDGSYQILTQHGTYKIIQGRWLVLSHSTKDGKAQILSRREIVFEFVAGGIKHRVVYRRRYEDTSGTGLELS